MTGEVAGTMKEAQDPVSTIVYNEGTRDGRCTRRGCSKRGPSRFNSVVIKDTAIAIRGSGPEEWRRCTHGMPPALPAAYSHHSAG